MTKLSKEEVAKLFAEAIISENENGYLSLDGKGNAIISKYGIVTLAEVFLSMLPKENEDENG